MFKKPRRWVNKVYLHCSASDNPKYDNAATIDSWHKANGWAGIGYHYYIRKDGTIEPGRDIKKTPAAQGGHNRGTIAICCGGLKDFTEAQFKSLRKLCQEIHTAYDGKVTFHGHCEVSSKLCPVFDYRKVLGLDGAGRLLDNHQPDYRNVVPDGDIEASFKTAPHASRGPVLRLGDSGFMVEGLQRKLAALGYHVGTIDGDFGARTRAAVLAFQADNDLITDGIAGEMTFEALGDAAAREVSAKRQVASMADLAKSGSRIADASVKQVAAGAATGIGGLVGLAGKVSGEFSSVKTSLDPIAEPFGGWGTLGLIALIGAAVVITWLGWKAGQARLDDHRTGKTS